MIALHAGVFPRPFELPPELARSAQPNIGVISQLRRPLPSPFAQVPLSVNRLPLRLYDASRLVGVPPAPKVPLRYAKTPLSETEKAEFPYKVL